MPPILQLARRLDRRPDLPPVPVGLRSYRGREDIPLWLALRQAAFATQAVAIGAWTAEDFEREFLDKPWWSPERMWFAVPMADANAAGPVGTVALACRGPLASPQPVIHWLCVAPRWRRRGIGRLLVAALEIACWDQGWREVRLETHQGWNAAAAFYRALGYRPL